MPFVLLLVFGLEAHARTFVVRSTQDSTDVKSLRGAIIAANRLGGNNTIILTHSVYQLTIPAVNSCPFVRADCLDACNGDLDVTKGNLTIIGKSASHVTITAAGLGDRVFHIWPRARLILSNLVITGGTTVGGTNDFLGGNGHNGGGIYNAGILTLHSCIVSNNSTGAGGGSTSGWGVGGNGGKGGGIYNTGQLTLNNSMVISNSTGWGGDGGHVMGNVGSYSQGGNGGDGGGIFNAGTLMLSACTVSGNFCGGGGKLYGNGGNGGGIYNRGKSSLYACIVSGNSAGADCVSNGSGGNGGGVFNSGILTLNTCVIGSNSAGAGGGAPDSFSFGGGPGGNGGGLCNSGTLTLNNCSVTDNIAGAGASGSSVPTWGAGSFGTAGGAGGAGGGIYNNKMLILNNCTISRNAGGIGGLGGPGQGYLFGGSGGPGGNGGGIYSSGALTMNACTVSGNSTGAGGDGGQGAGGGSGGNSGNGGGIYSAGTLQLNACIISDNSGSMGGSGGFNFSRLPAGPGGNGGNGGSGGGVFSATNGLSAILRNTLIALNRVGVGGLGGEGISGVLWPPTPPTPLTPSTPPTPPTRGPNGSDGTGPDLAGDFTSRGYNLIGQADGSSGFTNGVNGDLVGTRLTPIDPLLGPLQNNGGPTFTHALLPGSPAIDQGNSFGLNRDQRGRHRPHDFFSVPNAPGGDGSDIGAFELNTPVLSIKKHGDRTVLLWDASCLGYSLEATADPSLSSGWTPVRGLPSIADGQYQITDTVGNGCRFYRLRAK